MEAIEYYLRSPGTGLFLEISLKLIKKALKTAFISSSKAPRMKLKQSQYPQ